MSRKTLYYILYVLAVWLLMFIAFIIWVHYSEPTKWAGPDGFE